MKCPKCNGATTVVIVMFVESENERLRYRKCKACDHKFYTSEVEIPCDDYGKRALSVYRRRKKATKERKET